MPSMSFKMRRSTISSAAESLASNRQCVMADESCCIASGRRGEPWSMTRYDRNLVMAMRASEVMGAEVEEERMTCRKGWSIEGVSKVRMSVQYQHSSPIAPAILQLSLPLQPFKSFLSRAKADMSGLSCMLLPFFPRSPHLLGTASSCSPALTMPCPVRSRRCTVGVLFDELPRIAATEECAHRACLRMADVTVIHSVTTRATGFTATVIGRGLKLATVSWSVDAAWSSLPVLDMAAERWNQGCVCDKSVSGGANVSLWWWGQAQLYLWTTQDTHAQTK
jgi:hypothetical protein